MRFEIARNLIGEFQYFISLDDDVFLTPDQLGMLFSHLVAAPSIPHGITGNDYRSGKRGLVGAELSVEVLNMVYAFTAGHVETFFSLITDLGLQSIWDLRVGGDMVLSKCGEGSPRIHDLGPLLFCPTVGAPSLAVCRQPGFSDLRRKLLRQLRSLRNVP